MTRFMPFMIKLQVESEVGMVSLGSWVMCRCLDVCLKKVVAERVITLFLWMVYFKHMELLYIYTVYTMMLPFQVGCLLQSLR